MLFLDELVGDVFEIELATRAVRPLTSHFAHGGFTRARYLANGDVLLCGPREAGEATRSAGAGRASSGCSKTPLTRPAHALDEACFEGPAVSRRSLRIAWTRSEYPERVVLGRSEIWTGEIAVRERRRAPREPPQAPRPERLLVPRVPRERRTSGRPTSASSCSRPTRGAAAR